jgi:WD40 repeat protein
VYDVAFSNDGRSIVSASADGTARVWDAGTGGLQHVLTGHDQAVNSAVFSRDGRRVITGGSDGTVRIWDLAGGDVQVRHGHVGSVRRVALAPDGAQVASAGQDGTIRVWDVAGSDPSVVLSRHPDGAWDATFGPDGRSVLSTGEDGFIRSTPCEVCGPFGPVLRLAHTRADREVGARERERFVTR